MATQTGSIDLKAQKQAHDDAEKKATNYLVDASNNGLTIHPVGTTANRVLIDGNGMAIYKNDVSVAFYGDTARIGKDTESRIEMDYHSLQLKDREGSTYFYVSDLRDKDDNYQATLTETFVGDGETTSFEITFDLVTEEVSATDSSHSSNTATRNYKTYTFATAPDAGATVTIVYKTTSSLVKAYTLGNRKSSSTIGALSIAEGSKNTASGYASHAEGYDTVASGYACHAEGNGTTADGFYSHAEGFKTIAKFNSHAEGTNTTATYQSHAEGEQTNASGGASHAEGLKTTASGYASHAEGSETTASGNYSHASGSGTIASGTGQTVVGHYNDNFVDSMFEVGCGLDENNRKNAFRVDGLGELFSSRIGNILWTGAYYMTAGHTATLSDKVSNQLSGIVLVWSAYSNGTAQNYDWSYYFVPKWHAALHAGQSVDILMMNNTIASNVMCRKLVYVHDNKIVGNDNNTATGTGYANNAKVLRAVIGV